MVVQQVLVEAYNANLSDLGAHAAALRAAADALLASPDEMLTGGWVAGLCMCGLWVACGQRPAYPAACLLR